MLSERLFRGIFRWVRDQPGDPIGDEDEYLFDLLAVDVPLERLVEEGRFTKAKGTLKYADTAKQYIRILCTCLQME